MESGVLVPKCTSHQLWPRDPPGGSAVLRYLLSSVLSCILKLFKCRLAKKRDLGACKQEAAVLPLNTSISAASQPSTGLQNPAATPRGPRTCLMDTSPPSPGPLLGPSVPHSLAETHVAKALSLPPSSCRTPTELSREAPRPRQAGRVPGSQPRCRADAPPKVCVPLGVSAGLGNVELVGVAVLVPPSCPNVCKLQAMQRPGERTFHGD